MRKTVTTFAALVLAVGFGAIQAKASASGSIGCGGGNGASVPCNGGGLGTVTQSGMTVSGSVDVTLTSVTGIPAPFSSLQVFTPQTDQFDFSFSNVGLTLTSGGTFTFVDETEMGLLSVSGLAELGGTPPPGLVGPLTLVLDATGYTFSGLSGTLNAMGNATMVLDPGNVTSMTGSVGFPNVGGNGSTTPEPGTLLLLVSGLPAIGFIRRKLVRG
jgi:hypothetical protein